MPAFSKPVSDN